MNLKPTQLLVLVTLINYLSYAWWTLANKRQFSHGPTFHGNSNNTGTTAQLQSATTPAAPPLLSTTFQMLIASLVAALVIFVQCWWSVQREEDISNHHRNRTDNQTKEDEELSYPSLSRNRAESAHGIVMVEEEGAGGTNQEGREVRKLRDQRRWIALTLLRLSQRWKQTKQGGLVHRIVPLGLSRAVDIGGGNVALAMVSVALQQIIKSTLPVFVTVLTVGWLRRPVAGRVWLSLVPIMLGTVLALRGESQQRSATLGVFLAFVSCFGRAAKAVLNHRLLGKVEVAAVEPLKPLEIVLYEAPTTACLLLVPSLLLEWNALQRILSLPTAALWEWMLWWLLQNVVGGVCMFITQYAYVSIIHLTSALTCQVLMNIKMLLLVFASVLYFHLPYTRENVVGVLIAVAGCFLYAGASRSPVAVGSSSGGFSVMMMLPRLWLWIRGAKNLQKSSSRGTRSASV